MDGRKLTSQYLDIIREDQEFYYRDYLRAKEAVARSNAKYKGQPVPFLYEPMFFTDEDIDNFNRISAMVMSIGNKVTDEYISNPDFRPQFKYPKLLEELILVDPGYDLNIPICRFDLFYGGGDRFKFIEINTDGTSGMNEENVFSEIILESEAIKKMEGDYGYRIDYFELMDSWVRESLKTYFSYKKAVENPTIAIVDFEETGITAEFEEMQKAYERAGYDCYIIDPRDFSYEDGQLLFEGKKIDMIYRRIVTVEFIEKSSQIEALIEAYRDENICLIGSLRTQILHNKIIFKVLHDRANNYLFTEEELDFIKDHIPYTHEFKGDRSLYDRLEENKDAYIIKPIDSFASQGVFAGRDYSKEEWQEKLDYAWDNEYLCQEFIDPYKREFVEFDQEGKMKVNDFNMNVGVYIYNESFAGVYTRISQANIIFGREGYYSIPNLWVRGK